MSDAHLRGHCRVLYCLDVARAIDLGRAETTLASARRSTFHHRRAFPAEAGVAAPVRVSWKVEPATVGGVECDAEVEVAAYDFGAVAITWTLPLDADLSALVDLSCELYDNRDLTERSAAVARQVLDALGTAAERPGLQEAIEDYVLVQVDALQEPADAWVDEHRGTLARVLRASTEPLSDQEVEAALANPVAFGRDDLVLIDWLGALMVGKDLRDEHLLLELATVELLELRLLDARLDGETEEAYDLLTRPRSQLFGWTTLRHELERVARSQADDALLHQGIDNALKLFGDDYLARLYRVAGDRFHFDEWDAAIQRKLGVLERIYTSLEDQASHRRSELLEWIIILLIAIDIVLYFTPLR